MDIRAKVIRGCIRIGSVILCMGFCSLLLSRYFPSLLGFLASSSPIIFCTAILIVALISFGPNISKAKEEKRNVKKSVRTQFANKDGLVVDKSARVNQKEIKEVGLRKGNEGDREKEIDGEKKVEGGKKRDIHDGVEGHSVDDGKEEINSEQINSHNQSSALGSDADSFSPDASVTDMMPTLDELDLLMEPQAPAATLTPCDESDGQESDDASVELGRDVENVDEEEAEEKDVVTWSADDEKNLRNLGTLEIERNRRLENLIAKRIARKRWMVEAEKNLIDLDGDGMQITIPTRRNPFDPQYDFDEVPGSAPPILLPRLNPFDIPYEQAQEKVNPVAENSSHQESAALQQREMFFRRYESFTVGPSFLGEMNQEKHDFKFRPYFVVEGTGHDESYQRQSSGRNDSKVSSLPETDTVTASASSAADHKNDEKEPLEQESHKVNEQNSEMSERGSEFTEDSDSVLTDSNPSDTNEETSQDAEAYRRRKVKSVSKREGMHNGQVEEPFYDSSPSAREGGISHDDRESMSNSEYERAENDSDDEGLWMPPPKLCEVDENESRSSRGVKLVNERDVLHVGMIPEAIPEEDSQNISLPSPMAKEVQDSEMDEENSQNTSLSSPMAKEVQDNVMDGKVNHHPE